MYHQGLPQVLCNLDIGILVLRNPTTTYWTPNCQSGEKFTLKVCADNACGWGASEIKESNESNNILTHEVTCQ